MESVNTQLTILTDDEAGEPYFPDGKFYLNNQKILLSYGEHLDKQTIKVWLKDVVKRYKTVEIGHEMRRWFDGKETVIYQLTHVLIDFGRSYQSRSESKLDFEKYHPCIKKVKTKKQ